jgi:hypothetical protein
LDQPVGRTSGQTSTTVNVMESLLRTRGCRFSGKSLLTFLLVFTLSCCSSTLRSGLPSKTGIDLDECAETILQGTLEERQRCVCALHQGGKRSIGPLIERIDTRGDLGYVLVDPMQSTIYEESFFNPRGVFAAYMIELILARKSLDCESVVGSGFLLGSQSETYVFSLGAIAGPAGKNIDASALELVENAYRRWWGSADEYSLEDLRAAWQRGETPLAGSEFLWR